MGAGRGAQALGAYGLVLAAVAGCRFDATGLAAVVDVPAPVDGPALADQIGARPDHRDGPLADTVLPDTTRPSADTLSPDQTPACGAAGQPCCNGTDCDATLTCVGGSCARLPRIDGSGTAADNTGSVQVSVTTTVANDLIYVVAVLSTDQSVQSVSSSPSLAWTFRANHNYHGKEVLVTCHAISPSSGKVTITLSLNGGTTHWAAAAFGVSGVNVTTPFDGPWSKASGNSATASVLLTTSGPGLIIGAVGVGAGPPSLTPGTSFSAITTATNGSARSLGAEYRLAASPVTDLPVSFGLSSGTSWGIVADAIRPL